MFSTKIDNKKYQEDDKTLYTHGKERIPIRWLEQAVEDYLDKTTLIFGGSGSGKTTMVEETMMLCKKYIPHYIIIVPRTSDKAYRKKLPGRCIREDITKKKLVQIWKRQINLTQCYNVANDVNILEMLFNRITDRETELVIKIITNRTIEYIKLINTNAELNFADKRTQIALLEEKKAAKIKKHYKDSIRLHRNKLFKQDLSDKEVTALTYLDVNPRLMLVIDDCTEKFQGWMKLFNKSEDNIFESILYRGRHNFITLIIAAHDDKIIATELRKSARVIKFGTSQALVASLQKAGSAYNSVEKRQAMLIASTIYNNDDGGLKTHKKVCYLREDPFPFRYTIATLYDDFKLGSAGLWDLVKKMPKQDDKLSSNPFVKDIVKYKS